MANLQTYLLIQKYKIHLHKDIHHLEDRSNQWKVISAWFVVVQSQFEKHPYFYTWIDHASDSKHYKKTKKLILIYYYVHHLIKMQYNLWRKILRTNTADSQIEASIMNPRSWYHRYFLHNRRMFCNVILPSCSGMCWNGAILKMIYLMVCGSCWCI